MSKPNQSQMHRSLRRVVVVSMLLAACATLKNTPAQDLAWERWTQCRHFPGITLKEIRTNGQVWVFTGDGSYDMSAWQACMREALVAQRAAGKLTAEAQPPLEVAELRETIRAAYFTDKPPAPGTSLRGAVFSNMPPDLKQFPAGATVTFFYAVYQVGRVFDGQIVWLDPNGATARKTERRLDQTGVGGSWAWWTDTLPVGALTAPGTWTVDLRLNGQSAGRYTFELAK